MNDLTGRVALITGANRGIGRGVAEHFSRAGASVMCTARSLTDADATAAALTEAGGIASARALDVTDAAAAEAAVAAAVSEYGRLDILVNNAGTFIRGKVQDLSAVDFQTVVETDLNGVYYCTHAAIKQMVGQEPFDGVRGQIIGINSGAGARGFPTGSSYAAAKWGMVGLAESLRMEVAELGIKVTEIMVFATVRTGMSAGRDVPKIEVDDVAETILTIASTAPRMAVHRLDVGQVVLQD